MTRKAPLLATAVLAGAALAACHPRPLAHAVFGADAGVHVQTSEAMDTAATVTDRLDCPETVGVLTRTAAAADGGSCDYRSPKGVVHLAYAEPVGADPSDALAPLRAELDGELPGVAKSATIQVVSDKDGEGGEHSRVDMPFLHVEDQGRDANGRKHARVDMPFLHVDDDGRRSHVRLLGFSIDSDDHDGDRDNTVDSDDDDDAKPAAAPAVPAARRGVELAYVLAGSHASPAGYHAVGYVAKGGHTGRLVVATFRYRSGEHDFDDGDHSDGDIDGLMRLNVKPS